MLITLTCPTDIDGVHFARELAVEQSLKNLYAFSDRLAKAWALWQKKSKRRPAPPKKSRR